MIVLDTIYEKVLLLSSYSAFSPKWYHLALFGTFWYMFVEYVIRMKDFTFGMRWWFVMVCGVFSTSMPYTPYSQPV